MEMTDRSRRSYKSDLRAAQAGATRQAILDAAAGIVISGGWQGATIAAIAREAGVSKETVYAVFGSKVALIGEMVTSRVAEGAPGPHFLDGERPALIRAETDPARQIALWAGYLSEILERVAPVLAVVRSAAESEPEMAELYRRLHAGRRANLGRVAEAICRLDGLRDGLGVEEVTELLWQLASPELYGLMTGLGGYSRARHAGWLAQMLTVALLTERG